MVFKSRIHEDIVTEGAVLLKTERNFGYFGNCDVKIFLADKLALNFHISGSTNQVSKVKNGLNFPYQIISRNEALSGDDHYFLKSNRNYLFSGNYGDLIINGATAAKLLLKQKLFGIELAVQPVKNRLDDETQLKAALLILANIADLDGSSP